MSIDQRIQTLEDEHKLIRGELKQTLINIRDFLLDINLPAFQEKDEDVTVENHQHDETHKDSNPASLPQNQPGGMPAPLPPQTGPASGLSLPPQPASYMPPAPVSQPAAGNVPPLTIRFEGTPPPLEARTSAPAPEPMLALPDITPVMEEAPDEGPDEGPDEEPDEEPEDLCEEPVETRPEEALPVPEEILPEEEKKPLPLMKTSLYPSQAEAKREDIDNTEQVNLLTNLIRWVAIAKGEIGGEHLAAFLDVYSIGGCLPPESREVILHLADVVAPKSGSSRVDTVPVVTMGDSLSSLEDLIFKSGSPTVNETLTDTNSGNALTSNVDANADVWSHLIMELHGILGMASFQPVKLAWKENSDLSTLPAPVPEKNADSVESAAEPPCESVAQVPEDKVIEDAEGTEEEIVVSKSVKKSRSKGKKKGSDDRASSKKKGNTARIKIVLPQDDGEEAEFNIGGFSLNLANEED